MRKLCVEYDFDWELTTLLKMSVVTSIAQILEQGIELGEIIVQRGHFSTSRILAEILCTGDTGILRYRFLDHLAILISWLQRKIEEKT